MHELGIVFHIIDSIEEVGRQNKLRRVSTVTLELGEVSGVVHTYLEDCSRLAIEALPAVTLCEDCGSTYATVEHGKTCPFCQSPRTHLVSGNEINIKEIEAC